MHFGCLVLSGLAGVNSTSLSPGPLHWGAPAWSDGPGVKLLVPRSRTDLPGVKSLASYKQRAASIKQLDMKEIIGYILFISRLVVSG